MNPQISIIIPCYNSVKYLERCINSVKAQTYSNFEVIVVDDGSVDNTYEILNELTRMDNRFCVHRQVNKGVSAARNYGLDHARGQYIAFVDSDDWVEENWLSVLVGGFKACNVDMVGCNMTYRTEYCSKKEETKYAYEEINGTENALKYLFIHPLTWESDILGRPFVWNKLYKKSIIDQYGVRFDENTGIGEDYKFNYDYIKRCKKIMFNKEACYNYLQHPNNTMEFIRKKRSFSPKMQSWPKVFHDMYNDIYTCYPEIAKCCESITVRLYIRCLYGMLHSNKADKDFENKAVDYIKQHWKFKQSYDKNSSLKYVFSAVLIRWNYPLWRFVMHIL